jgi:hypothetical protein
VTVNHAVRVVEGLLRAERCVARPLPRVRDQRRRQGIRFQNNVAKALRKSIAAPHILEIEPWFQFYDKYGRGQAVPDFIILTEDAALVVECKLTFVPEAVTKLRYLYVPVIQMALGRPAHPIVMCKHLVPGVIGCVTRLSVALELQASVPTMQWLGHGDIQW